MIKIYPKITNLFSRKKTVEIVSQPVSNYQKQIQELNTFCNHLYEYKKGVRQLILTTEKDCYRKTIEEKLTKEKIDFLINPVTKEKINVFFGAKECVDVVKTFNAKLNKITPEQDFMLGIMLGYDKVAQCLRYLKMKTK